MTCSCNRPDRKGDFFWGQRLNRDKSRDIQQGKNEAGVRLFLSKEDCMATPSFSMANVLSPIPRRIHSSCDFVQALMKLQRAAQLITSSLDLDMLLDRVVNDIAEAIGCVEVSVWLRDPKCDDMVLHGVRGCTIFKKGARAKIGVRGMVGHVALTGETRYARDVSVDPYYVACELDTRSEVIVPLKICDEVIGVLCVDHKQTNAFSNDQ